MAETRQRRDPGNVLFGRDNYLFENGYGVPEYVTGSRNLSPALVRRWISLIETRHAWCRQRGARYFLLIAPDKHVVHADKLPSDFIVSTDRAVVRLLAALTPEIRDAVLYPATDLMTEDGEVSTHFISDSHWTEYGAWLAYRRLRRAIWPEEPEPDALFDKTPYRRVGDLGVRLEPARHDMGVSLTPRVATPPRRVMLNFSYNIGQVEIFERDDRNGRRCVMFRDSAGGFLLPFLANDFDRLVAVASDSVFYDLLRSEKPDVVINQITEHSICMASPANPEQLGFPNDLPAHDFTGFTGIALPLVRNTPPEAGSRTIADLDYSGQRDPVWSDGPCTEIVLRCPVPYNPCELELSLSGFVHPPAVTTQHVDVVVNSHLVGSFDTGGEIETLRCVVPLECLFSPRTLRVELFHPGCVAPADLGAGDEQREIAVRLHRLILRSANGPSPNGPSS